MIYRHFASKPVSIIVECLEGDSVTERHRQLARELCQLEKQLRDMGLWSESTPSSEALASSQPFAVDTLTFLEWLQFIFLPRMQQRVDVSAPLPTACAIAPMVEEYFRGVSADSGALLALLASIDEILS
ncbi:YqcC family protein [Porticoccus sp.]